MDRRRLRSGHGVLALAGAVVLATVQAGGVSAAHVARLDVQPRQVAPGGEIAVSGPPGWAPSPVSIRWNGLDGDVLGTFPTTPGANASFGPGTVRIPNVAPGTYELVGIQDVPGNHPQVRGVPARARITVTGPGGAVPAASGETPPVQALRSLKETSPPAGALLLLALGAFALTLAAGLLGGSAVRRKPIRRKPVAR